MYKSFAFLWALHVILPLHSSNDLSVCLSVQCWSSFGFTHSWKCTPGSSFVKSLPADMWSWRILDWVRGILFPGCWLDSPTMTNFSTGSALNHFSRLISWPACVGTWGILNNVPAGVLIFRRCSSGLQVGIFLIVSAITFATIAWMLTLLFAATTTTAATTPASMISPFLQLDFKPLYFNN